MSEAVLEGAACRPNFSPAGRRRRLRVAQAAAGVAGLLFLGLVAAGAPWGARLVVALPVTLGAISWLQVRRNTCVAHAATGSFEHDDFSLTKVDEAFAAASRRVAATIYRDGLLAGAASAVLAVGSAFVG